MHSVRRSVFRAVTSSSSLLKSRSIAAPAQFAIRANKPAAALQILNFRRWNSDEAFERQESAEAYGDESSPAYSGGAGRSESGFQRPVVDPCPTIYVGNLSFEMSPDELQKEFETYGKVVSVRLATDARGLSKGFGYVEYESTDNAAAAIAARDQTSLDGRRVVVNYQAGPKSKSPTGEPSKTLFIGNLAFEMSDADLNKLFRDIRNVIDVRVAIDRRTGQPRGFAHADFVDVESAQKGMEYLQGKEVYGRELRVDFSGTIPKKGGDNARRGR